MKSCLYECRVMHARFSPRAHHFVYRIFMFALDLDEIDELDQRLRLFSAERRNLYSFRDRDYLPTGTATGATLKQRVLTLLGQHGIATDGLRIQLVTLPRVAGYLFNPVSFYFCQAADGTPVAAVPEVTNTFKEMKPFVLGPQTRRADGYFHLRIPKHFYVSPFSDVDVAFDFQLSVPGERLSIQIDDYVKGERTLTSTLTGPARPLTDGRLAWFTLLYPLITLKIITLIHWQALRLYLKSLPWFRKAARPADQRGLYRPHASLLQPKHSDV
ncbi:MAG: DUF1365 domain-containing protein [Opitutaceae bacterium]|nr:DUF1365 domain-containing protein [Opitutaceae bacterium]